MANLSSSNSDAHFFSSTTSTSLTTEIPPKTIFSDFQFRTIGRKPDLLNRISDYDAQIYQDPDTMSPSPSLSPDLARELIRPSDQSPDGFKQPSLHERLDMLQVIPIEGELADDKIAERPSSIFSWQPNKAPLVASEGRSIAGGTLGGGLAAQQHSFIDASPLPNSASQLKGDKVSIASFPVSKQSQSVSPINVGDHAHVGLHGSSASKSKGTPQPPARTPESHSEVPLIGESVINEPSTSTALATSESPSFATLRLLQVRLSTSLANLNPISTEDVILLAHSAKEQCTEVSASADRAYLLAQKALISAEESMSAARECLGAAEIIQRKTDEVMAAVEKFGNEGQEEVWNDALQALTADLHQLERWASQMEAKEAKRQHELTEREAERRHQEAAVQLQRTNPSHAGMSSTPSSQVERPLPLSTAKVYLPEPTLMSVEHEADAAAQAWSQIREQSAERRKIAEEQLRKRREEEERLEREQKEAQAAVAAREAEIARIRAERIEAEEQEKARQEKEAQDAEMRRKELERKREEAARQRKASEERALKDAEEKEKALLLEKEQQSRLLAEEQKRKEIAEREALQRQSEVERAQAFEAQRQRQLHEQDLKRQEISAQKQRAAAEAAKKIQSDRAKMKQSRPATPAERIATPSTQIMPLPSIPTNYDNPLQNNVPPQLGEPGFGNESRKMLLAGSPDDGKKKRLPSDGTDTGSLLNRIVSVATSSSMPSSASMGVGVSGRSPSLLVTPSPIPDTILSNPSTPSPSTGPSISAEKLSDPGAQVNKPLSIKQQKNGPQELIASLGPSEEHARVATPQMRRRTSLPPVVSLPEPPSTPPRSRVVARANISAHSNGPDVGNIALIPRSQVPPISPEAQKANLRPLMNAHGIPHSPGIKPEPEEEKLFVKLERNSVAPISSKSSSSTAQNIHGSKAGIKVGPPRSKRNLEPPNDIPLLSLPSPPAPAPSCDETSSLSERSAVPETRKIPSKLPIAGRHGQKAGINPAQQLASSMRPLLNTSGQTIPSTAQTTAGQGFHSLPISANLSKPTASPVSPVSPLPPRPQVPPPVLIPQAFGIADSATISAGINDYYESDLTSRMGPDAATTEGWTEPSALQEDMPDPVPGQRQRRARAPRPRILDHYSPPPPASSSHVQQRSRPAPPPRRGHDHYSPPRRPLSPLPTHNGYSRNSPSRSRSRNLESPNDPRAATPVRLTPQDSRRSVSPPGYQPPPTKRKRPRGDDQVAGPPNRRPRYEAQPAREIDPHSGYPRAQYASSGIGLQDEWSHIANYSRSPTPEPRPTPLYMRLEEADSSRPQSSTYRPNQGSNNNRSDPQTHHRQIQGSYYDQSYQINNTPRQNSRNPNNDSRPPLLERFSDSATYPPRGYPQASRIMRPRGRGGHQPLGQRIAKNHLIDRLEVPKEYHILLFNNFTTSPLKNALLVHTNQTIRMPEIQIPFVTLCPIHLMN
ncbi:hypothetical protein BDZ97DRAFT_647783 [Flammula alnicola]|nr:hypothetical protein BDZ97DRAFT_647783 [Flammula alnicola]